MSESLVSSFDCAPCFFLDVRANFPTVVPVTVGAEAAADEVTTSSTVRAGGEEVAWPGP